MKQRHILWVILSLSLMQMATNAISSVMEPLSRTFSDIDISVIQFLMTFPGFFIVIFSLLSVKLCQYVTKRSLLLYGLSCMILAGMLSFWFYDRLGVLYVGAAILGIGVGLCASLSITLISDYFPQNKEKIMGLQTSFSNIGSMLMTFVGGCLAVFGYRYVYMVYFLALLGMISVVLFLPKEPVIKQNSRSFCLERKGILLCMRIIVFMVLFYIAPTSLSFLIAERGLGNSMLAGMATALLLLGGSIMGLLFEKAYAIWKQNCKTVGFLMLAIGYTLLYFSDQTWLLLCACFLCGTSISLLMPQCMLEISLQYAPEQINSMTALAMASSNIGILIAPLFTVVINGIFPYMTYQMRFLAASGICFVIVYYFIWKRRSADELKG